MTGAPPGPDERASARQRRRGWPPSPLSWFFLAVLAWDVVLLWMIFFGIADRDVGNDAAGTGMARAFREVSAMAAAVPIAILAMIYLVVRREGVRAAVVALLALAGVLLPVLR